MQNWKHNKIPWLLAFLSLILYWFFAYDLIRTDYTKLIILYSLLWTVFILFLKTYENNMRCLTIIAFLCRAVFILAIPNLSQDFYRFIWDGRMILEGFNPYLFTPESFIQSQEFPVAQSVELYTGMGQLNASHFSNYPPLNQLCFAIAGLVSGQSILGSAIVLRLIIIAADFGTLVFGKRILNRLNISEKHIFWYILNPFIIIELTGNLHFEGVMIFFLVWSIYLLLNKQWKWAAVVFALSISIKLIPLLFLPLLFKFFNKVEDSSKRFDIRKLLYFYGIVGLITLLLFAPFFSLDFITNYTETIGLWFNNFEFNASVYYIAREIGYLFRGYNEIAIIGKILPVITFICIIGLALFKSLDDFKTLIKHMLLAFTCYLFLSTTVHPWYLSTLLILSIFTNYKFPLVWSFVIILSYLAYINIDSADKSENLWIIGLEYAVVFAVFIWELFKNNPIKKSIDKSF